jgi:cytosine/adenosine deaminase-related metal-dependent hydrolase
MSLQTSPPLIAGLPQYLLLCNARVALNPWHTVNAALLVRGGKIESILPDYDPPASYVGFARVIDFSDHLILPGLVNAHDHLHFGIFPRLGKGPYPSWREWASDIYHPDEPPLRPLLDVPKAERLWWGMIRNALAGVTTVSHHDKFHPFLDSAEIPVNVHSNFGWAHSLDDSDWAERCAQTPADWPFIVHFAEGVDPRSRREAITLERKIDLNDRIVLVHAVGVTERSWQKLRAASAWIVWCPTSNLHILGRTLARDLLLNYPFIALGSDSPISAAGDLLAELQAARALFDLPSDLLYQMVTTRPARLLRLSAHEGAICAGGAADLLIVRDSGLSPSESLASLTRSDLIAVIHNGKFTVVSNEVTARLDDSSRESLFSLDRHGFQWHVAVPPKELTLSYFSSVAEPLHAIQQN